MPNPNEVSQQSLSLGQEEILAMFGSGQRGDLAGEIAALRKEISDLRTALVPVPSLILTGQQALDEFRRMTGVKP